MTKEEVISKQALMKALEELPHEYGSKEQRARTGGIAACQAIVSEMPAATLQEPKTEPCEGELKPCPFCGGKATYDTNGNAYWVICPRCGAKSRITYFGGDRGKRIVTEAWNRRV